MINAPVGPACPPTHPQRKNRMIPRTVEIFGVKTPVQLTKRPFLCDGLFSLHKAIPKLIMLT
jgi:hypothetical protein